MAKVTGPLLSESASGSVSPCLTFSERKTGSQVRFQKKQKRAVASDLQSDHEGLYRKAFYRWSVMTDNQKNVYNDIVKNKKFQMTGWNYFLKKAIEDPFGTLGIVIYSNFNYISAGKVLDKSGNGFDGDLKPTYPSNCPVLVDMNSKTLKNGLSFDGGGDCVDYGNIAEVMGINEITLSAWIKTSSAHNGVIWSKHYSASIGSFYFTLRSTPSIQFSLVNALGSRPNRARNFDYTDNKKHLVQAIYNGSDLRVRIDGTEDPSPLAQTGLINIHDEDLFNGKLSSNAYYLLGWLDEAMIYNRAIPLAESEIMYKTEVKLP